MNGKGSARRGTSKEEMKRFSDNYDDIFRKPRKKAIVERVEVIELSPEDLKLSEKLCEVLRKLKETETCSICSEKATWVRRTQFAGDHPYCDLHAKQEKDFMEENDSCFWQTIKDFLDSRK